MWKIDNSERTLVDLRHEAARVRELAAAIAHLRRVEGPGLDSILSPAEGLMSTLTRALADAIETAELRNASDVLEMREIRDACDDATGDLKAAKRSMISSLHGEARSVEHGLDLEAFATVDEMVRHLILLAHRAAVTGDGEAQSARWKDGRLYVARANDGVDTVKRRTSQLYADPGTDALRTVKYRADARAFFGEHVLKSLGQWSLA